MPDEKKTEEQLRHEIRKDFSFSEERDKERIDKALQLKKDRYTATQAKKKAQGELAEAKKAGDPKGKQEPNGTQETNTSNYSLQDIRALGKVHDEDVERVEKFAKSEGITIAEAMNTSDLNAILRNRTEKRKTAEATNTGGSKRKNSKISNETLLEQFEEGNLPENTDKLAQARMDEKKSMIKRT